MKLAPATARFRDGRTRTKPLGLERVPSRSLGGALGPGRPDQLHAIDFAHGGHAARHCVVHRAPVGKLCKVTAWLENLAITTRRTDEFFR